MSLINEHTDIAKEQGVRLVTVMGYFVTLLYFISNPFPSLLHPQRIHFIINYTLSDEKAVWINALFSTNLFITPKFRMEHFPFIYSYAPTQLSKITEQYFCKLAFFSLNSSVTKLLVLPHHTLITVTRNLFSSSSCMAPLMEPIAQHRVFRFFHDHSVPFTWLWSFSVIIRSVSA